MVNYKYIYRTGKYMNPDTSPRSTGPDGRPLDATAIAQLLQLQHIAATEQECAHVAKFLQRLAPAFVAPTSSEKV
jgi:hypothetical protein